MGRGLSIAALPAETLRGLRFIEDFYDKSSMLRNEWTLANNPIVDDGITVDGVNQKAEHVGPVIGVQSVSFWITLGSTTEDILQLSAAHSIEVGAGTLTATGWAAPTIMVNGVVTAVITTARSFVTVTTATPFDADDIAVGEVAAFGDFKMEALKIWANGCVLTLQEALDSANEETWDWENLLKLNLQFRTSDLDMPNVQTLDSSKWGNHAQLGDGVNAATMPAQGKGRMTFDGGDWLVNAFNLDGLTDYTLLMTFATSSLAAVQYFFTQITAAVGLGFCGAITTVGVLTIVHNNGGTSTPTSGIITAGPINTVVVVVDSGNFTVFLNGIQVLGSTAMPVPSPLTGEFTVSRSSGARFFGDFFDFKVDTQNALTPTQVWDYDNRVRATLGSSL